MRSIASRIVGNDENSTSTYRKPPISHPLKAIIAGGVLVQCLGNYNDSLDLNVSRLTGIGATRIIARTPLLRSK